MPDFMERRVTSASIIPKSSSSTSSSSIKPYPVNSIVDKPSSEAMKTKRFSLVHMPRQERRVTIRPYDSFRERDEKKDNITFGYAALSTNEEERRDVDMENGEEPRSASPSPSIFSIYGDEPGPSTICEQPVGAQADVFIASLGEKKLKEIKKFIENTPRDENMYFLWVKDAKGNKITVISIKTLENHYKNDSRVRRVKWRHLSSERVSIYRYSLPAITYEKSKLCRDCMCRHKKLCLLLVWLAFVLFLCLVVVLGSLSPDDRAHPFAHNQSRPVSPQGLLAQHPPAIPPVLLNTSLIG